MQIFAISPGWKEKPATESQILEPLYSAPTKGSIGMINKKMPNSKQVYLKLAKASSFGIKTITTIRHMIDANNHAICFIAVSCGARRNTKQIPIPANKYTIGRIAGSAPGVNLRSAICVANISATSESGTAKDDSVSFSFSLSSSMTKSKKITGVAAIKSQSSVFLLVVTPSFFNLDP